MDVSRSVEVAGGSPHGDTARGTDSLSGGRGGRGGSLVGGSREGGLTDKVAGCKVKVFRSTRPHSGFCRNGWTR